MPRFAKRSWVAVGTFMTLGVLVSTLRDKIPFGKQILFKTEGLDLL
jgi:hypothetical protein